MHLIVFLFFKICISAYSVCNIYAVYGVDIRCNRLDDMIGSGISCLDHFCQMKKLQKQSQIQGRKRDYCTEEN